MYEKLKMLSNTKEVEDQLSSMLRKMVDVKFAFGSIDVIKIKYIEQVKILNILYIRSYVVKYLRIHS